MEIKTILHVQSKGAITNKKVQELYKVSKRTASTYLSDLKHKYIEKTGGVGKGTSYV